MSDSFFNKEYYQNCCGPIAYTDEHFPKFFGQIADRIVEDLHPKTVLDAGCAMGYLVAALRDRGVEAWGIDISNYAIGSVREDIKPYCMVGSLTEKLPPSMPDKYDLVITIEVIEHMYEEDGKRAIENLCSLTDKIIFSSSANDYTEYTHYNVQQREYWTRLFAENNFLDDLSYRPQYITPWSIYFVKGTDWLHQLQVYEHHIRIIEDRLNKIEEENAEVKTVNERLKNENASINSANEECKDMLTAGEDKCSKMQKEYDALMKMYQEMLESTSWKITTPFRIVKKWFSNG
ncbi:methyltransferase domain-containing protein [Selenomonas ruminantium]|uniref:methyltransferase domain-containing protein n=1 Tax=Selenomonas ruminantium TaxID=971 RepID=UPI00055AE6B5|nr:methyltransferase domain-containing protein [Selenomonas ruminantium]